MAIFKKPILRARIGKSREMPEGLWTKCPTCGEVIHNLTLSENLHVCPKCAHHFTLGSRERIASLVDPESFQEIDALMTSSDPLNFKAVATYADRLASYKEKTGLVDAIITGTAQIAGHPLGLGVMDFNFLAATLGSVVGEKVTRIIELSTKRRMPVVLVCASGGARMYEGMLSLMQLAKTSGALALHAQAKLPYIAVLTDPTTAGVMASYASLGDIIIAEPGSMIGFAGPRVIRETTQQTLPPDFQTAEFLEKRGLIDIIVHRSKMRSTLGDLLGYFSAK
ncbi:MAG: acetyl-CoA carboxylase, carboxyltransferase subunit beta [Verrucomicrobiota bacterium]